MIKINLASDVSGTSALSSFGVADGGYSSPEFIRKEALKRLVLLAIGPLALIIYENQNLPTKEAELRAKQAQLLELQNYNAKQAASVAEIKKFKEDEALIETRIAALEKISVDRLREIRVMELIQNVIPEKAWLTRLEVSPQKVNIQGLALSDFEVSALLEALTKSVFLMDVTLLNSSELNQEGVTLKRFEISCLLERPE